MTIETIYTPNVIGGAIVATCDGPGCKTQTRWGDIQGIRDFRYYLRSCQWKVVQKLAAEGSKWFCYCPACVQKGNVGE